MSQANFSPAADRNKDHILAVLRSFLPPSGSALEIASGTGQHIAWFAQSLAGWTWQPTDAHPDGLGSMSAWLGQHALPNVRPPLVLDVMSPVWLPADKKFDLIYCANMLHIAPWPTCSALMQGSARHLAVGGRLVTYGPYLEEDVVTSEGNLAFDQRLRLDNPAWGIRRTDDVAQQAAQAGLQLAERHAMPANNLLLVWTRQAS